MRRIAILENPVLPYEWGSRSFLPKLLGLNTPATGHMAELWMGAHPRAPSKVVQGAEKIFLPALIQSAPEAILGRSASKQYNQRLPFLFKILAVAEPLSLQVHPGLQQARKGFSKENRLKISLDAADRNFRDPYHKPEIICALGSFWALFGFRPLKEIDRLCKKAGLHKLAGECRPGPPKPEPQILERLFKQLMSLKKEEQKTLVNRVVKTMRDSAADDPVRQWVRKLSRLYPGEIAALAPLFLHLVHLKAGEALYVAPGEPHAYLKGNAIELSANSDNTLRGGLTHKHVHLPEFLKSLSFTVRADFPVLPRKESGYEEIYTTAAGEFQLSRIRLPAGQRITALTGDRVSILICIGGRAEIGSSENPEPVFLESGSSVLIPAAAEYYWLEGRAVLYKATIPFPA